MKAIFTPAVSIFLIITSLTFAQIPPDLTLIAHYKLDGTPDDATGNNAPMQLTNTPYQDGGIYCNGIYTGNDPVNGSDATTPIINGFRFKKFAIQAKFKVSVTQKNPVIVGGTGFRWMEIYLLEDSTLRTFANNGSIYFQSSMTYSLDTFHTITMVYDSVAQLGKWYIDNMLIDSTSFIIDAGNDKNVSVTDFGSGDELNGVFDDLKIYSLPQTTDVNDNSESSPLPFKLEQNYPNPFNPSTNIKYSIPQEGNVQVKIYGLLGNEIMTLVNGYQKPGNYEISFDGSNLTSGIYFYQIKAGSFTETKKMVLIR
ncbi:hypothetical protein BMS3Abin04_01001 [bacterium BMS3Abin04]|nr:hypothetical protein BMS3Abin04_01001 [bacterium BMS3Abin04]